MTVTALIQARMGSTRLPGKVLLSLGCTPIIRNVVRRAQAAESVEAVVVATTIQQRDDIVSKYASKEDAEVVPGDETYVLDQMYLASISVDADRVIRLTADNPLVSPAVIHAGVRTLQNGDHQYVSNKIDRSFLPGLDVELFTSDSFAEVESRFDDPYDREHETPTYRESGEFACSNLESAEVFDQSFLQNRTGLRLTLDGPDDFAFLPNLREGPV